MQTFYIEPLNPCLCTLCTDPNKLTSNDRFGTHTVFSNTTAYHNMRNNLPTLPNGGELPDDANVDAVHITRDSKSTYIHLLSRSGDKEAISCTQISGRIGGLGFEDHKPFVPSSHFGLEDAANCRKICCPNCEQFIDPSLIQRHILIECGKEDKFKVTCELCGRKTLQTTLADHMLTHGPKRYMCSYCGRKFHRWDYLQNHMNRPNACLLYLDELSLSLLNAQDEDKDGINLDDPMYSYFVTFIPEFEHIANVSIGIVSRLAYRAFGSTLKPYNTKIINISNTESIVHLVAHLSTQSARVRFRVFREHME